MMETCYVLADRFSTADFLHGPIAMIERSFPVFLFAPPGVTWPGMRDMLDRLHALKAETLIVTDAGHRDAIASKAHSIVVPARLTRRGTRPMDLFTPIPYIVPAQLLSAYLAVEKGLDPDRPRTLSKVTRTL
jgi:glucosamine--fructose-6-phosphate aminotransferase (isomerizing)